MSSAADELNAVNDRYATIIGSEALNDIFDNTNMNDVFGAEFSADYSKGPISVGTNGTSSHRQDLKS
ncbi:hypothetical protein MEG05_01895 [Vibrio aestuarianus]|uniref:hypothetical protein n=1 Tax=Vibrio aestuarianus TaxID=28171 RepID=UPI00237C7980|nr:hypothetical protein [Vibrio aestuarianus]MDE1313070.1 hypothetical protein [Vibrio aestuarianus]